MLSLPHMDKPVTSATVARHTKLHLKNIHADAWTDLKDQGRTVPLHGDLGSRFIPSGGHLHDSEYCFAFAARLNLVETRSVMKRHRMTSNDRCRHCGSAAAETLAHALQICSHNEVPTRYRHDASLEAITAAIRKRNPTCNLLVNSTMPGFPGDALRPDIQLLNETKKQAIICDLAIVFEHGQLHDGKTVFEQKAASKRSKYQPLSRHLVSQGYEVFNCALVYGALGSVAPDNKNILCGLFNLGRHAARSLESQLSADHIKASRRIWRYLCRTRGTSVPGGASGGTQSQRS
ncbi:hypothetical protein Ae201684P_002717 [Aphanomyces euteiches]|nr:hypothetical protein Ae201684P_002717 [Aphanomyces euteiches]